MIYAEINFTMVIHFNFAESSIEFISFQQHKTPIYIHQVYANLNGARYPELPLRIYHLYKCPIQIWHPLLSTYISFVLWSSKTVSQTSRSPNCLLKNTYIRGFYSIFCPWHIKQHYFSKYRIHGNIYFNLLCKIFAR